jgi:hypothetical protein
VLEREQQMAGAPARAAHGDDAIRGRAREACGEGPAQLVRIEEPALRVEAQAEGMVARPGLL